MFQFHRLLASGLVVLTAAGCTSTASHNQALHSGSNAALTYAEKGKGNSTPSALGGVPQPEKKTAAERLMAPLRVVKNGFSSKPVDPPQAPDPLSLSNTVGQENPAVFLSAARLMSGAGNLENAKNLYEKGLMVFPDNRDAILELARVHVQLREFDQATEVYLKAVEKHPSDPIVFNDLGLYHMQQKRHELGIKAFHRAVELDPQRKLYRNNLANAYVEVGREDLALDQLLAVQQPPVAHYNLGYLLYSHQRIDAAITAFDQAYRADHNFQDAYMMMQRLQQEQRQRRAARAPSPIQRVTFEQEISEDQAPDETEKPSPAADHKPGDDVLITPATEAPSLNEVRNGSASLSRSTAPNSEPEPGRVTHDPRMSELIPHTPTAPLPASTATAGLEKATSELIRIDLEPLVPQLPVRESAANRMAADGIVGDGIVGDETVAEGGASSSAQGSTSDEAVVGQPRELTEDSPDAAKPSAVESSGVLVVPASELPQEASPFHAPPPEEHRFESLQESSPIPASYPSTGAPALQPSAAQMSPERNVTSAAAPKKPLADPNRFLRAGSTEPSQD